jgi:hypothetical protein
MKSKLTKKQIYPDGTLEDDFHLPRGHWEAKDTADDLDAEIKNKIAKGYPLANTSSRTPGRRCCSRTAPPP